MTNSKYVAILLDLDDTLLNFSDCEREAFKIAFAIVGTNTSDSERIRVWQTYQSISSNYWRHKQNNGLSRQQIIEASLQDTFAVLKRNFLNVPQLAQTYWNTFCQTACLNPEVKETIKLLSNDYRLGIVTNGYADSQASRLEASGLASYFQSIVVSEVVGCRKPASEIFNIALKELQVKPFEVLFVGDSLAHDYKGAANAGIDFCYFNQRSQSFKDLQPKYSIEKMSQLIGLLPG